MAINISGADPDFFRDKGGGGHPSKKKSTTGIFPLPLKTKQNNLIY
jgi:hypothetical protein